MKAGIRVLLLTLVLSSCTDYPTMSIWDQDIMVLHRTIPNPMVTQAQAITTVPDHTIPNPMVTRAQAITTVSHHTIPNPMGIRAPVGKWLPVIAETVATESKGLILVLNR